MGRPAEEPDRACRTRAHGAPLPVALSALRCLLQYTQCKQGAARMAGHVLLMLPATVHAPIQCVCGERQRRRRCAWSAALRCQLQPADVAAVLPGCTTGLCRSVIWTELVFLPQLELCSTSFCPGVGDWRPAASVTTQLPALQLSALQCTVTMDCLVRWRCRIMAQALLHRVGTITTDHWALIQLEMAPGRWCSMQTAPAQRSAQALVCTTIKAHVVS